jgi:hypothetical protein
MDGLNHDISTKARYLVLEQVAYLLEIEIETKNS